MNNSTVNLKTFFKPKTFLWALCNEDFSDLTIKQIAEVFDKDEEKVYGAISYIKKKTGYSVRYKRLKNRKTVFSKEESVRNVIINTDFSDMTKKEAIEFVGCTRAYFNRVIKDLKSKGFEVKLKKK